MRLTQEQVKWHIKRFDQKKLDRANFDTMWQEIAEHIYPAHANFTYLPSKGEKRMRKVYDSTGIHSNELLASGLFSLLTSSASKWFEIRPVNWLLYQNPTVRAYFDIVTRIMFHEMNRPSAGFATAMHENYLGYGAFGNLTNYVSEIPEKNSLLFQALPLYECYYIQNQHEIVDTLYRKYTRTVEQLVRKFGKDAPFSDAVKKYISDNKLDKIVECLHIIAPREVFNRMSPIASDMPFTSAYMECKEANVIQESGYPELPFFAARFYKESFETYGRGPGSTTLPDVKMLMRVAQVTIRAAQKGTDPPVMTPHQGFLKPLKTTPGSINYYERSRVRSKDDVWTLPPGDVRLGLEYSESLHKRIREAFFVDQLQLHEGPQMTATEVMQRTEEKLRLMGPLLGRIQLELLGPMLIRVHNLLQRAGKFPEPPAEMEKEQVKVVYTSAIARAQEQVEANGLMRALGILEPIFKYKPDAVDVLNEDETIRGVYEMFSVNPRFVNDLAQVKKIRDLRAEAERKKQEAENLRAAGQGADSLARGMAVSQESGQPGFGMLQ